MHGQCDSVETWIEDWENHGNDPSGPFMVSVRMGGEIPSVVPVPQYIAGRIHTALTSPTSAPDLPFLYRLVEPDSRLYFHHFVHFTSTTFGVFWDDNPFRSFLPAGKI